MDIIKFNYRGTEREALVGLIDDVDEIIYRVTPDDGYENNFFVSLVLAVSPLLSHGRMVPLCSAALSSSYRKTLIEVKYSASTYPLS